MSKRNYKSEEIVSKLRQVDVLHSHMTLGIPSDCNLAIASNFGCCCHLVYSLCLCVFRWPDSNKNRQIQSKRKREFINKSNGLSRDAFSLGKFFRV